MLRWFYYSWVGRSQVSRLCLSIAGEKSKRVCEWRKQPARQEGAAATVQENESQKQQGPLTQAAFPQGIDPCLHFTGQTEANVPHINSWLKKAGVQNEVSSSPHWARWRGNFAISFHWKSLLVWWCAGTVRGKHWSEALYKVGLYPTFVVLLRLFV